MHEVMIVNPSKKKNKTRRSNKMSKRSNRSKASYRAAAKKGWRTRKRSNVPRSNAPRSNPRRNYTRRNAGYGTKNVMSNFTKYAEDIVTVENIVGASTGAVASLAIPHILGWDKGWYGVAASGGTTILGGMLIGHFNENAGKAFGIVGIGITAIKAAKMLIGGTKAGAQVTAMLTGTNPEDVNDGIFDNTLGELGELADIGQDNEDEEELFGVGQDFDDDEEEELFDLGQEESLVPTFEGY